MLRYLTAVILSALFLAMSGTPGDAADATEKFAIHGNGGILCRQEIEDMKKDKSETLVVESWAFGYLSGLNSATLNVYDLSPILDGQSLAAIILSECAKNPNLTLQSVVSGVYTALSRAAVPAFSPTVIAKAGGKSMPILAATLAKMQTLLAAQGQYDGKPDGSFGPKFEAALRAYQKAEKLPETGLPDNVTIVRLLIADKTATTPPKK